MIDSFDWWPDIRHDNNLNIFGSVGWAKQDICRFHL